MEYVALRGHVGGVDIAVSERESGTLEWHVCMWRYLCDEGGSATGLLPIEVSVR